MTAPPSPGQGTLRQAQARVTFLGTGTSSGVPVIACECATCTSSDPRDKRLRPSIFVDVPGHASILVDTTPDLRQQALTYGIRRIDAILFTHGHADHILGLDEIRRFNWIPRTVVVRTTSTATKIAMVRSNGLIRRSARR